MNFGMVPFTKGVPYGFKRAKEGFNMVIQNQELDRDSPIREYSPILFFLQQFLSASLSKGQLGSWSTLTRSWYLNFSMQLSHAAQFI